jgi:hypothetical protein
LFKPYSTSAISREHGSGETGNHVEYWRLKPGETKPPDGM